MKICWKITLFLLICFWTLSCEKLPLGQPVSTQNVLPIVDATGAGERDFWIVTAGGKLIGLHVPEDNSGYRSESVSSLPRIQSVSFATPQDGWVLDVFDSVWSTKDAGKTWHKGGKVETGLSSTAADVARSPGYGENQIIFDDHLNGWVSDSFSVWYTRDQGYEWTRIFPTENVDFAKLDAQPLHLYPLDDGGAWLGMTNGMVLITDSSRIHWRQVPLPVKLDIQTIYAVTSANCFVGVSGAIFSTRNGGRTWHGARFEEATTYLVPSAISFISSEVGWFVASRLEKDLKTPPTSALFRTDDSGENWTEISGAFEGQDEVRYLRFFNREIGWACTGKAVYLTHDGGLHWNKVKSIDAMKLIPTGPSWAELGRGMGSGLVYWRF